MTSLLVERQVTCPSCWEQHPVVIDLTGELHSLIEDCRVCCNPMQITYEFDGDDVCSVNAEPLS